MTARNINSLQALLEYVHKLPWGHENNVASRYLDGALDMIDADINAGVAPEQSGVGQK